MQISLSSCIGCKLPSKILCLCAVGVFDILIIDTLKKFYRDCIFFTIYILKNFKTALFKVWNPRKPHKSHKYGPKYTLPVVTNQIEHYLTFGTKPGHVEPCDDLFRGQKAVLGLFEASKGHQIICKEKQG